jgi:regulation of enolase protein 1 (concanavalin A-like superfamily)
MRFFAYRRCDAVIVAVSALVGLAACSATKGTRYAPPGVGGSGGAGTGGGGSGGGAGGPGGSDGGGPPAARDAQGNVLDLPPPPATVATPDPWKAADVGAVGVKGETGVAADRVVIQAGGEDIFGKEDGFHFAHQTMRGDGEIVAKVKTIDYTHAAAKAGLMFRGGLEPGAANVFVAVMGNGAGQVQWRPEAGADTKFATDDALNIRAGVWLKITRSGNRFTVARSPDRGAWTAIGTYDVTLPEEALVGLAATSHDAKTRGYAEFDAIRLANLASTPAMSGWLNEDVGVMMGRAWAAAAGVVNISAMGDTWTTSREYFHFVFKQISGDFSLTARVASLQATNPMAWAGLMARKSSITSWSRSHANVLALATPEMGVKLQHRAVDSTAATAGPMAADARAPVWLRLERAGEKFTTTRSADGVTWEELGAVSVPGLPENLLVGIAASSSSKTAVGTASFDNVKLIGAVTGGGADGGAGGEDAATPDAGGAVDARPAADAAVDRRRDMR